MMLFALHRGVGGGEDWEDMWKIISMIAEESELRLPCSHIVVIDEVKMV